MENIEEVNKEFNSKKPKKKGLILGIVVLALVIVALISVCLINSSKPEKIYYSAIDKILKIEKSESNSIKLDTKTKITAESDDNTNEEELEKLAKCAFGFGVQTDAENKKEIVNLSLEYENNPEISAQLYYNNDAAYAYLDGIFDKYIKIELEDEQKEDLKTIFESAKSTAEQEKLDKAIEEIKKEIKKQISEIKDFEQEKTTIKINGKEQKIKKTSVKLTDKQLCDMLANIYTDLSENDKYLENFDESQKDSLKEIANAIKGIETTGKNTIKISLYTKGLSNKLIGTNVEIYSAKEKQTAIITITKKDKNVYKYDISMKMTGVKANIVKGEAILEEEKQENGEKGKITLTAETSELMELGKAKIEIEYNVVYNQKIDEPNVENNVNVKDLSQTDMVGIMSKIMQKPLLGEFLSKGLFDHVEDKENENIQNDNIVSDDFIDFEI